MAHLWPIQGRALRELVVAGPTAEDGERAAPPVVARAAPHLRDEPAVGEGEEKRHRERTHHRTRHVADEPALFLELSLSLI